MGGTSFVVYPADIRLVPVLDEPQRDAIRAILAEMVGLVASPEPPRREFTPEQMERISRMPPVSRAMVLNPLPLNEVDIDWPKEPPARFNVMVSATTGGGVTRCPKCSREFDAEPQFGEYMSSLATVDKPVTCHGCRRSYPVSRVELDGIVYGHLLMRIHSAGSIAVPDDLTQREVWRRLEQVVGTPLRYQVYKD